MTRTDSSKRSAVYLEIWNELKDRSVSPWTHPSFLFYFIVSVVGFGGLGIWLELYVAIYPERWSYPSEESDALRTAIVTFFPVVAGTAATQLLWAEKDAKQKHLRSTAFALLTLFLALALWIYPQRISNTSAICVSAIASIGALWMWVVANAKQVDLLDEIDPSDSVGGSVGTPLPGSTHGFKTN